MQRNSPLDFLLFENASSDALFGETDTNEVFLPDEGIDELGESPEHEAGESGDEETDETLDSLSKELKKVKDTLDELKVKYPEDTNGEVASALDDATSAIDLAVHHLDDIESDLNTKNEGGEPTQELEDMTMPGGEGGELPPEELGLENV